MLTRKSAEIPWTEENDADMERWFRMTDAQRNQVEAELDVELAEIERRYAAMLASLSVKQRYQYERRNALLALLRARTRVERLKKLDAPDFVIKMHDTNFRKRQLQLLDWRRYRTTGILPTLVKQ